jgi:hypothetical protein
MPQPNRTCECEASEFTGMRLFGRYQRNVWPGCRSKIGILATGGNPDNLSELTRPDICRDQPIHNPASSPLEPQCKSAGSTPANSSVVPFTGWLAGWRSPPLALVLCQRNAQGYRWAAQDRQGREAEASKHRSIVEVGEAVGCGYSGMCTSLCVGRKQGSAWSLCRSMLGLWGTSAAIWRDVISAARPRIPRLVFSELRPAMHHRPGRYSLQRHKSIMLLRRAGA